MRKPNVVLLATALGAALALSSCEPCESCMRKKEAREAAALGAAPPPPAEVPAATAAW